MGFVYRSDSDKRYSGTKPVAAVAPPPGTLPTTRTPPMADLPDHLARLTDADWLALVKAVFGTLRQPATCPPCPAPPALAEPPLLSLDPRRSARS